MKPALETSLPAVEQDPRWMAIVSRDRAADGQFYYSVETTGVYCRPSCPSRLARPSNVRLHATREAAEAAGFRPCRRCRPDLPPPAELHAALVARACRVIEETSAGPVSVARLAADAGVGLRRFQQLFRQVTGLTPAAYATEARAARTRERLRSDARVIDAAYAAGFGSPGRFYAAAGTALGMSPQIYRRGGAGLSIVYGTAACSLGIVLAARTGQGLCAVMLGDDAAALVRELADRFPRAALAAGDDAFETVVRHVAALVDEPWGDCRLPLDLQGTVFQRRVWRALRDIPPGHTITYAELARRIGAPAAVRAVGTACGANPVAVIVPCHRVVGTDGRLTGYRWGVERKRRLIEAEAAAAARDGGRPPRSRS